MARSKSSGRWLQEHFDDEFVLRAQREGYRSRAIYKLIELQEKDRLIKPGDVVVDLGAAPGGWSQYAAKMTGAKGKVVALDLLSIDSLPDVEFIQGDFREDEVLNELMRVLAGAQVDVVLSDMAPNMSGEKSVDQPRSMYLVELAKAFCDDVLREGGTFAVKMFQGEGSEDFIKGIRNSFKKTLIRKPKASRPRSPEVYVVGIGYKN